jgi:phage shock protein PspC (stress-responsive transcriptional regulator)
MLFIVSATQGPSGAARIEDTVKDFWATRPRRPRRGRKIAGVAVGIANRYRIDPVLVRVGFVVAAVYGGAGVVAYLLGWLFLPEQDDEVSPAEALFGKGRSSTSSGFTILLGIIAVPVFGWFFSGSFTGEFSSWMSLIVIGGLIFLLHQARGNQVPITPARPATPAPEPPVMPVMPVMTTPMPQPTMPMEPPVGRPADVPPPEPRDTPPAWDPLGAAPFAWDLPEPTTPEPEEPPEPPKRRKPKIGTATLGIAIMAAAFLAIAGNMSWADGGWVGAGHVVGVVLAIIGLGLVFGAFKRSGRGLIALAVPLSVVGMGLTAIGGPENYRGVGDLIATPTSLAELEPVYERSVGDVEVDLTSLPDAGRVHVGAHAGIGNVEITVPESADVIVSCESHIGHAECLGHEANSIDARITRFMSEGDTPGGLVITIMASVDTGNVEVHRG